MSRKIPPDYISSSVANGDESCMAPGSLWSLGESRRAFPVPDLLGLENSKLYLLPSDFFWLDPLSVLYEVLQCFLKDYVL